MEFGSIYFPTFTERKVYPNEGKLVGPNCVCDKTCGRTHTVGANVNFSIISRKHLDEKIRLTLSKRLQRGWLKGLILDEKGMVSLLEFMEYTMRTVTIESVLLNRGL